MAAPYVAPNELIQSAWGNAVVDDIAALTTRTNRLMADTSWVGLAPTGNWSGTINSRRVGAMVTLTFALSKIGANFGPGNIMLGQIPAALRPSASIQGVGFITVPNGFCRLVLDATTGNIEAQAITINGGGPVVVGSLTYPISLP